MRAIDIFFGAVIVVFISFSCKNSTLDPELLGSNCRLSEFTLYGISYTFQYDSQNLPTVMSRVRGIGAGYSTLFFEYKDKKLVAIFVEINGNKYPDVKFEYQKNNLTSIQHFTTYQTNFQDTAVVVKPTERVDFHYTSGKKPAGLIDWFPDERGMLYKRYESVFEYDSKGNLVRERRHFFAQDKVLEADYLYEYFYDEKPNSRRLLHSVFFHGMESVPMVFSSNNMNRKKIGYEGTTFLDQTFSLTYNLSGNLTADNYQYLDMKWICE